MDCAILIFLDRNTIEQSQQKFCLWNTMYSVSLAAIEMAVLNVQKNLEWGEW